MDKELRNTLAKGISNKAGKGRFWEALGIDEETAKELCSEYSDRFLNF